MCQKQTNEGVLKVFQFSPNTDFFSLKPKVLMGLRLSTVFVLEKKFRLGSILYSQVSAVLVTLF